MKNNGGSTNFSWIKKWIYRSYLLVFRVSNPQLFAWASDCAGRYWSEEKKRTSRETRREPEAEEGPADD
jgi:hypothetical protein